MPGDAAPSGTAAPASAAGAVESAVAHLFREQRPNGIWRDAISRSAVATAPVVMSLHHADPERFAPLCEAGCEWLRRTQHADGSWGDAVTDPGTLNATALAVPVLKLVGGERSVEAVVRGLAWLEAQGGPAAYGDRARCSLFKICQTFMVMAGLADPAGLDRMPLELALIPRRLWRKFSVTVPGVFSWAIWHDREMPMSRLRRLVNRVAEPRALAWLARAQGADGSYEESPLLTAIVHLGLVRAGAGAEIAERCLAFLLGTRGEDGSWAIERDVELSVTTYILLGMEAAGRLEDGRLRAAVAYLLDAQSTAPFEFTGAPAGAWTWGLPAGWPDCDDTAGCLIALRSLGVPDADPHLALGEAWLRAMQNGDGSWSMFVKDSDVPMDRACPGVTARAAQALWERSGHADAAVRRALAYLRRVQRPDGSVPSLWFRNSVAGTAAALEASAAMGIAGEPLGAGSRRWLLAAQRADGSWGGDGDQPSTVEETAWALGALLAAGAGVETDRDALDRAAAWLVSSQRPDGAWPAGVVGLYFSSLWYSSDHIANGFALRALARYCRRATGA